MILGIGVDLVRVDRFESWIADGGRKLQRFFSPEECRYCLESSGNPAASAAARFAAREAFGKALGTGIGRFSLAEIQVVTAADGRPGLRLDGAAESLFGRHIAALGCRAARIHLSLSHERDYAVAYAVIEGEE